MNIFTVAFIGHRIIENPLKTDILLEKQIKCLLQEKEYIEFLVGRNGEFDQCATSAVRKIKRIYRNDNSSLILVLPYPTREYLNNKSCFKNYYDEIYFPYPAINAHPKSAILIRNKEMIDRADLVICFVKNLFGGAYKTIEYAKKQGKTIINLAQNIEE